jgi:hypothetical protein
VIVPLADDAPTSDLMEVRLGDPALKLAAARTKWTSPSWTRPSCSRRRGARSAAEERRRKRKRRK